MNTTTSENTSLNVSEIGSKNSSNEELIKRERIEGTPFDAINEGKGWFLTMGRFKITETTEDLEELRKQTEGTNWGLLGNVVSAIVINTATEMVAKKEAE